MDACQKLVAAGLAANCRDEAAPFRAKQAVRFDLPTEVPRSTNYGELFQYDSDRKVVDEEVAAQTMCPGPHCGWYASPPAHIFVRTYPALATPNDRKLRAAIDAL